MKRYPTQKPGEWVKPKMKGYKLACCDCGLIHTINFAILKYGKKKQFAQLQFQVFRDNRATGQMRRHRNISVKKVYSK